VVALLAPVIAPTPVNTQFSNGFAAPTAAHPLGLDGGGFDVLSRLVHGAQTSLLVGLIAALVGMVIGGVTSLPGALYGAIFIQFIPNIADQISKAAPWAIYGAMLILFMYTMPTGIAGAIRLLGEKIRPARS
jgi:branched-chain amino acid transport system permease protein